ncbi:MAG: DNA-binding protein [Deltaproteobacteria bacterium]|nr:DNA-binding protein [Deltaproteobacteria bacterium]
MAQLLVRNLDDILVQRLKIRAANHHRSAEAEHREILREILLSSDPKAKIKEALLNMPSVGEDADFERALDTGRDIDL